MRARLVLFALCCATFLVHKARAFPDGAPWGAANPAVEQDCAACHFGNEPVLASAALVIRGLPGKPEPGASYDLEIAFEHPDIVVAGFQLLAQTAQEDAGLFSAFVGDVEFIGASIRSTAPLRMAGRASWHLSWRAPLILDEPIDFYVAASAANDDGSPFGDTIHFKSYRLTFD